MIAAQLSHRASECVPLMGSAAGGDLQPQLNFQSIVNAIDFQMDPQQIAQAPNRGEVATQRLDLIAGIAYQTQGLAYNDGRPGRSDCPWSS